MIEIRLNNIGRDKFLKRMFYLAWKESSVRGMGIMQDYPQAGEEEVWKNIMGMEDYPSNLSSAGVIHADYVFGRMMKLLVEKEKGNSSSFFMRDEEFNGGYNSFAGKYPTPQKLLGATAKSLEEDIYNEEKVRYEVIKS